MVQKNYTTGNPLGGMEVVHIEDSTDIQTDELCEEKVNSNTL